MRAKPFSVQERPQSLRTVSGCVVHDASAVATDPVSIVHACTRCVIVTCNVGLLVGVRAWDVVSVPHAHLYDPGIHHEPPGMLAEVWALHGRGGIPRGLRLLIASPVARVVCAVGAFALQQDWLDVGVTAMVLSVLVYRLLAGHP